MAVRNIVKIWNEDGIIKENIDFLHKKTKPVTFPLKTDVENVITDLIDSYKAIPCAGIAANQIGYDYSIFIGMKNCDDVEQGKQVERMESEADKYEKTENETLEITDDSGELYVVKDAREFRKHIFLEHSTGTSIHEEEGHYFTVDDKFRKLIFRSQKDK